MLSKVKTLKGYRLDALDELDGKIGKVKEFYFDDRFWTIRYLVAETGTWLASRQVLISPYALIAIFNEEKTIDVALAKKQIENSPSLDTDKPVSHQFEDSFYGYYDIPVYWAGPHRWGYCPDIERDRGQWKVFTSAQKSWDPHLRSTHHVSGYTIQASDGEIGASSPPISDLNQPGCSASTLMPSSFKAFCRIRLAILSAAFDMQ